jgi:WD40 repeat protein
MTKEFNNQRRGDQRPDSRDSSSRRFRLSRLAQLGLNRDIVDRTSEKGARQNPADYHTPSESNIHPTRDNRRPRNWRERFFKKRETDGTTQVSDAKQFKTRIPSPDWEHFAILTPKGLAIGNKTDGSGELKFIYTGRIPVKDVKWSPGKQKSLAILLTNGDLNVYNLPKDTTIPLSGHTAPVTALAWSPDGKYIASGSDDNTVRVWQVPPG